MNKIYKTVGILLFNSVVVFGMGGTPPPPPPFISLDATGTPYRPPLFLVDTNSVTLNVQFSFYSPSYSDGKISYDGTSTLPISETEDKNFTWTIPQFSTGVGFSFKIWKSQELFGALDFSVDDNNFSISNLEFGLGFLINRAGNVRARFDLGLSYISTDVTNKYLYNDWYYSDTPYMSSSTNNKKMNFFAAATIQTAFDNWPVNPFVQVSYCPYTFFTIVDTYNKDVYFTSREYSITPGLTYKLSNKILLVAGGSIFLMPDINNMSPPSLFSGFMQVNFLL